jgi:hypothetical protein
MLLGASGVAQPLKTNMTESKYFILLPNVQDQTRPALARKVRLGAHSVTA